MKALARLSVLSRDPAHAGHLSMVLLVLGGSGVILCFLLDAVYIANFIIPGSAFLVGAWLYATRPVLYLGFVWWVWFLTPFFRRFVDYHVGYHNPVSFIMLSPYLVTGISVLTLFRFGRDLKDPVFRPFAFVTAGILYGFMIALVKVGVQGAVFALFDWLTPVFLGIHVALFWRYYNANRRVLTHAITWSTLLIGSYGVFQYFLPPPWDMEWLVASNMWVTMGPPEPQQFRVFSTLNSTGPFAFVMVAGLLMLFSGTSWAARIALVPGYLSLLLTLVRAAWGGWVVGIAYMIFRLRGRLRKRLIYTLSAGVLLLAPILIMSPGTTDRIGSRAGTISNIEDDGSFRARLGIYIRGAPAVAGNPFGNGIGSTGRAAKLENEEGKAVSFDSGIFDVLLSLGWMGSALYMGGLVAIFATVLRADAASTDSFTVTAAAIALSFAAMMLFVNMMIAVSGAIAWTFMGAVLASRRHHMEKRRQTIPS